MDQSVTNLSSEPQWSAPPFDTLIDNLLAGLEKLFASPPQRRRLDTRAQCRAITGQVAASLHIDYSRVLSRERGQHISHVRQIAMYLCRKSTGGSWHALAEFFCRDHATVIHGYQVIQHRIEREPTFARFIQRLEAQSTCVAQPGAAA